MLKHSSIIWPIWLNGWLFVYKLSGCNVGLNLDAITIHVYLLVFFFIRPKQTKIFGETKWTPIYNTSTNSH